MPGLDHAAVANARALRERYAQAPNETKTDIIAALAEYSFYHCIEIAPGIETPGIEWTRFYTENFAKIASSIDFKGKRVLDIGCRDGGQAFQIEKAGAAEIHCIDNDLSPGLVNFLIPFLGSKIQCRELNLYDLDKVDLRTFDIINCCGVLYHLQFPMWGLKQIRDALRPGGMLILETGIIGGLDKLPMLAYLTGTRSPYGDGTSPTFFNVAGLEAALDLLGFADFFVRSVTPQKVFDVNLRKLKISPLVKLSCIRIILTCRLREIGKDSVEKPYFESNHRIHSRGLDRPLKS